MFQDQNFNNLVKIKQNFKITAVLYQRFKVTKPQLFVFVTDCKPKGFGWKILK